MGGWGGGTLKCPAIETRSIGYGGKISCTSRNSFDAQPNLHHKWLASILVNRDTSLFLFSL